MYRGPSPDSIPEQYLQVGGFRRVRGHEYYVEWRDVTGDHVAEVFIEFGAHGPSEWLAAYTVRQRGRGGRIVDQGTIGTYPGERFETALQDAVDWMRDHTSGHQSDMKGDFDFS